MPLDFDGTADNVDLPDGLTTWQNVSGMSFTAWIMLQAAPTATNSLFGFSINAGAASQTSRFAAGIVATTAFLGFGARAPDSGATIGIATIEAIPLNTWTHVAITVNISGDTSVIYLDGEVSISGATVFVNTATDNTVSTSCRLAARDDGAGTEWFEGPMADVRTYARVLTAAEVQAIYTCNGHDLVNDYVNRWILDEGADTTAATAAGGVRDLGLNKANGTAVSSPLYVGGPFTTRRRYY